MRFDIYTFYTRSPAGPGEPAAHEEDEEEEEGRDEEPTAELKKSVEEREDEREEEEDEQEERAKVDVAQAVDGAADIPEASGEDQRLCEDVQLQSA